MNHTQGSLTALPDRELDSIVSSLVFDNEEVTSRNAGGQHWHNQRLPAYSTAYDGLGLILDRLQEFGLDFLMDITTDEDGRPVFHVAIGDSRDNGLNVGACVSVTAPTLPRAVAMAAVLACR